MFLIISHKELNTRRSARLFVVINKHWAQCYFPFWLAWLICSFSVASIIFPCLFQCSKGKPDVNVTQMHPHAQNHVHIGVRRRTLVHLSVCFAFAQEIPNRVDMSSRHDNNFTSNNSNDKFIYNTKCHSCCYISMPL